MKAIFKEPGKAARLIDVPQTEAAIRRQLGGEFEATPALKGAQVLSLVEDADLQYNVTFLACSYCGPILIVGRGENDEIIPLSDPLRRMTLLALGGGRAAVEGYNVEIL